MSVQSTPELVVYARDQIEQLAKALVLSWHNDPAYNWDPDKRAITFDELIVNYYGCYRCSHEWVGVYPAEPDDVCLRVLLTSGYSRERLSHSASTDEGMSVIAKPYKKAELAARLRAVLDG
jgi:hypothetical protein